MSSFRVGQARAESMKKVVARDLWDNKGYTVAEIAAVLSKPFLWVVGVTKAELKGGKT